MVAEWGLMASKNISRLSQKELPKALKAQGLVNDENVFPTSISTIMIQTFNPAKSSGSLFLALLEIGD
jgi:hypothetical protein